MSHITAVRSSVQFIDHHLTELFTLNELATNAGYAPSQFHTIFSRVTGQTPGDYIRCRRLSLACWELAFSKQRILDLALKYHFGSQEAFSRAFLRRYGLTPGRFRRQTRRIDEQRGLAGKTVHPVQPGENQMDSTQLPAKKVLDGVMRVGFYAGGDQCPEDIPFPSCLASLLRYRGEDYPWLPVEEHNKTWRLNYGNVHFLGASGMAFGLLWREGWHLDNADHMFVADPREVIRRAFVAAGYDYEIVEKQGNAQDEQRFTEKIMASINRGVPVLAFGIIGPPECCLVTGYDEGGHTLVGWNYFQNDPAFQAGVTIEPSGYFRKRDWFKDTWSLIIVGQKQADFDTRLSNREMLTWALKVMRTPEVYGRHSGLAAFEAWRRHILNEADFADKDADTLRQRHTVHDTAVGLVAEGRYWGGLFLKHIAAESLPMESDLMEAAACMKGEHDLMWEMWAVCGGNGNADAWQLFKERENRLKLAELIQKAQALDETAAKLIERALTR